MRDTCNSSRQNLILPRRLFPIIIVPTEKRKAVIQYPKVIEPRIIPGLPLPFHLKWEKKRNSPKPPSSQPIKKNPFAPRLLPQATLLLDSRNARTRTQLLPFTPILSTLRFPCAKRARVCTLQLRTHIPESKRESRLRGGSRACACTTREPRSGGWRVIRWGWRQRGRVGDTRVETGE